MNTKQYVKAFYEVKAGEPFFNTERFLIEFNREFNERLETEKQLCKLTGSEFTYQRFQRLIKEMDNKFQAINNKLMGMCLDQKVFNTFFGNYVIPIRMELFPEIHAAITAKRERYIQEEEEEKRKNAEFVAGAYHE